MSQNNIWLGIMIMVFLWVLKLGYRGGLYTELLSCLYHVTQCEMSELF